MRLKAQVLCNKSFCGGHWLVVDCANSLHFCFACGRFHWQAQVMQPPSKLWGNWHGSCGSRRSLITKTTLFGASLVAKQLLHTGTCSSGKRGRAHRSVSRSTDKAPCCGHVYTVSHPCRPICNCSVEGQVNWRPQPAGFILHCHRHDRFQGSCIATVARVTFLTSTGWSLATRQTESQIEMNTLDNCGPVFLPLGVYASQRHGHVGNKPAANLGFKPERCQANLRSEK